MCKQSANQRVQTYVKIETRFLNPQVADNGGVDLLARWHYSTKVLDVPRVHLLERRSMDHSFWQSQVFKSFTDVPSHRHR